MKQLVSTQTLRILTILENTYFQDRIEFDEIMVLNECSKATVKTDVEYMHSRWGELLLMEVDTNSISINIIALGVLNMIKKELYQEEVTIVLLMNIYFYPKYRIYDHANNLNFSESYLRKTITRINSFLSVIDAKIDYIKEGAHSKPIIVAKSEVRLVHLITELFITASVDEIMDIPQTDHRPIFERYIAGLNLQRTNLLNNYLDILGIVGEARLKQEIMNEAEIVMEYEDMFERIKFADFITVFETSLDQEVGKYFGRSYIDQHLSDFKSASDVIISILLKLMANDTDVDTILNRFKMFGQRFAVEHTSADQVFKQTLNRYGDLLDMDLSDRFGEVMYNLYIHIPNIRPHRSLRLGVHSDLGTSHAYSLV